MKSKYVLSLCLSLCTIVFLADMVFAESLAPPAAPSVVFAGPDARLTHRQPVSPQDAVVLAQAAAEGAFASVRVVSVRAYTDIYDEPSVYAVELALVGDGSSVTVLVSARRDDVPVMMMWLGLPKDEDARVLERTRTAIWDAIEVGVSCPEKILWLDLYELWAVFPEIDPRTGEKIVCNLYSGRLAACGDLEATWRVRMNRMQNLFQESEPPDPPGEPQAATTSDRGQIHPNRTLAARIREQWLAAERLCLGAAAAGGRPGVQAASCPESSSRTIAGVPNLDQAVDSAPDIWLSEKRCGECGILPSMNILLYWDERGYDRLVRDRDLMGLRRELRVAMKYDCGTAIGDMLDGFEAFTNSPAFARQYAFDVGRLNSFAELQAELDANRPAMIALLNYDDDPENQQDKSWGNHGLTAVGYDTSSSSGAGSVTEWVVVFDSWGGGNYANPYVEDDKGYINWLKVDYAFYVHPGPEGLTYPNADGIVWQPGQTQLIEWIGNVLGGSDIDWILIGYHAWAEINLLKNGFLDRAIGSLQGPQPDVKSFLYSVPSDIPQGSECYSVAVKEMSQVSRQPVKQDLLLCGQDFEVLWLASAVDAPADQVFDTGGDADWFRQTSEGYSDGDAAQSGPIGPNEKSSMSTTVIGPGTVRFQWRTSSEMGHGKLVFSIDGSPLEPALSGNTPWEVQEVNIPQAGVHALEWTYVKDGAWSAEGDCALVDAFEWIPALAEAVDNPELVFTTSYARLGGEPNGVPWLKEKDSSCRGGDAARSGRVGVGCVSWMQTIVDGCGEVAFDWKLSSEGNCALLAFYIDGRPTGHVLYKECLWTLCTVPVVGSGPHTLTWSYARYFPGGDDQDGGWVDNVRWTKGGLAEAIEVEGFPVSTGGDAQWFWQRGTYYRSVFNDDAAQSGDIGSLQESWMKVSQGLSLSGGRAGSIRFHWKVSSQPGVYLEFYIDDAYCLRIDGNKDWEERTFPLPSGWQSVKWRYAKGWQGDAGQDCGWVDCVTISPGSP